MSYTQPSEITILFVGGMTRSGTTLIAELLTARDEVALLIEYDFQHFLRDLSGIFSYHRMVRPATTLQSDQDQHKSQVFEDVALPTQAPANFPVRENALAQHRRRFPSPDQLQAIATAAIRVALEKPHATVIGCKSPYFFIDHTDQNIAGRFGSVKYIFMIRGPVGQINSSLNRGNRSQLAIDNWPVRSATDAVAEYRHFLRVMISFALCEARQCMFMKYEELIASPQSLSAVGAFLNIADFTDQYDIIGAETGHSVLDDADRALISLAFEGLQKAWPTMETIDRTALSKTLSLGLAPVQDGLTLYDNKAQKDYLGAGWSLPEDEGVWTSSEWADLIFTGRGEWIILASFIPYMPLPDSVLAVQVTWNGDPAGRIIYTSAAEVIDKSFAPAGTQIVTMRDKIRHTLSFGPFHFVEGTANVLKFSFGERMSPAESELSADSRLVGLKLYSLQLIGLTPRSEN